MDPEVACAEQDVYVVICPGWQAQLNVDATSAGVEPFMINSWHCTFSVVR